MDRFYSALDINALTSLSETFPYALTEGTRFHLATVATAVGGIPYLIDQDVNGYLFTPGDWEALGRHLAALGRDDKLRRSMQLPCVVVIRADIDILRFQLGIEDRLTGVQSPVAGEEIADAAGQGEI